VVLVSALVPRQFPDTLTWAPQYLKEYNTLLYCNTLLCCYALLLFLRSFRIHVIDLDPTPIASGGWLEDTSAGGEYEMPRGAVRTRGTVWAPMVTVTITVTVQYMLHLVQ